MAAGAGAHLVVDQVQSDCCFAEGSISYLVVRGAAGTVVTWREFAAGEVGKPTIGLDVTLDPGTYTVDSFQRPCDANCSYLDPPTVKCSRLFTVHLNRTVRATVRLSVQHERCLFSR